jgi:hypothetical protein
VPDLLALVLAGHRDLPGQRGDLRDHASGVSLGTQETLVADYSVFTNAYAEACRKGTLSVDFGAFLKQNHMRLSGQFLRA